MKAWRLDECSDRIKRQVALQDRFALSLANMEPTVGNEPMAKKVVARLDSQGSVMLGIHSKRRRLADADGISAKALIDGLVHAGLLADDRTENLAEVRFSQQKDKTEETIVIVSRT